MIISKSQERVELTMALFAKFWVKGHQEEFLVDPSVILPDTWPPNGVR
jgi:hypothetical protein